MRIEEREKLMEFYERIVVQECMQIISSWRGQSDLPLGTLDDIYIFICNF